MNKVTLKYILICFILPMNLNICAQVWTAGDEITLNVSAYALIATNSAPVTLNMISTVAGEAVGDVSNSDLFVKISSITPGGTDREITARISSGSIPAGTVLTLVSAPCTTTNSGGDLGTALTTPITLSNIDQTLVVYISTCYTGTGYNDGYQMTFNWAPIDLTTNYSLISSATYNITVVFTLSAHDGN
ncbi:MAG: hypothetical protein QM487_04440 [Candidatus Marithrix sp.]